MYKLFNRTNTWHNALFFVFFLKKKRTNTKQTNEQRRFFKHRLFTCTLAMSAAKGIEPSTLRLKNSTLATELSASAGFEAHYLFCFFIVLLFYIYLFI